MRRWGSVLLHVVCLAFVAAGLFLWVRTYTNPADLEWFRRYTRSNPEPPVTRTTCVGVGWGPGAIALFHYHGESSVPAMEARTWLYREFDPTRTVNAATSPADRLNLRLGRFQLLHRVDADPVGWLSLRIAVMPMWFAVLAAGAPLAIPWLRRRGRRQRRRTAAVPAP